jgi:8-oxo-dGTP pyrophosphatase MutT (NUDIX family)
MSRTPIVAAGCLITRPGHDDTEVLLVHRPRYDDWSLPKGKAEAGEHLTSTAVREVLEETGLVVALRRPLPMHTYKVDGTPKEVHYWRAVVVEEADFVPGNEVDKIRWLSVDKAAALVTRPDDALLIKLADDPAGTPFLSSASTGPATTSTGHLTPREWLKPTAWWGVLLRTESSGSTPPQHAAARTPCAPTH